MESRWPLVRTDAAEMLKRRLQHAGLPAHSFRATGITNFLENDGTPEAAQRIAGHADSRTTKLYDRRGQKVLLEEMEMLMAGKQINAETQVYPGGIDVTFVKVIDKESCYCRTYGRGGVGLSLSSSSAMLAVAYELCWSSYFALDVTLN
jgi:hypothetical protein